MAERTPSSFVPVPDSGQPPVERAPDTQAEGAPAVPAPANNPEQVTERANAHHEKPSDTTAAPQEQKEPEVLNASAEPSDAKRAETPEATSAAPAEEAPAPEANGTPASTKKSKNSKRRSSGVAEPKARPNKKKPRPTHLHAQPGEYYLARLRSYPQWPSIICDEEMLPETLLKTRPVTAMRPDGTYREDYADGGKRAHERTFPVMFFGTNEFAWIPNMDLEPTDAAACKDVPEKSQNKSILRNKSLVNAYTVAGEGRDLQACKAMLADHERAIQQEIQAQEEKAAAKAEKQAKKGKRKSTGVADEEDVEMEDADGEAKKSKKASRKRKKEPDTDGEGSKPAKTPKTKLKLTSPKTLGSETETKATGKAKRGARGKKGAQESVSDEEESELEAKEPEKQIDPEEQRERRKKEILYLRYKLQKGFITRDEPPREEEMTTMSGYFSKLESYTDLEVSIIRSTRVYKLLRMILKLSFIPRDEEFHFRQRAMDILSKWRGALASDPAGAADEKDKDLKRTTNGLDKEGSAETPTKTDIEEKEGEPKEDAAQPAEEPMPDADVAEKTQAPKPEPNPKPAKEEPEKAVSAQEGQEGEKVAKDETTEKPEEKPVEAAV